LLPGAGVSPFNSLVGRAVLATVSTWVYEWLRRYVEISPLNLPLLRFITLDNKIVQRVRLFNTNSLT
jgi:hypothetical protein